MGANNVSDDDKKRILDCLIAGKKIAAIKIYREVTGEGLKEAKDFVDELSKQASEEYPELLNQNKGGCFGLLFILIIFTVLSGFVIF